VPVWGGIVWGRSYQAATASLTINASTVESYWRHRYWTIPRWYTNVDQYLIAAGMLLGIRPVAAKSTTWIRSNGTTVVGTDATSGQADSDGITIPVNVLPYGLQTAYTVTGGTISGPGSAVTRTLHYLPGKNVYDALVELMAIQQGFEWTCDPVRLADGSLGWTIRFGMPLGRFEDVTGLQFGYRQGDADFSGAGSNILNYTYSDDAVPSADRVIVTGPELDAYIPSFTLGDLRPLRAGYPLLEATSDYSDSSDTGTLSAKANGDLADAALPVQLSSWTVRADGDFGFGSAQIGDRAVFNVSDLFTPQQASGLPGRMSVERIVGWNLVPEQREQAERWELTTNPITQPSARLPRSEARAWERFSRRLNGLAITPAQGQSITPVTYSSGWVQVPLATATDDGATVTITDITFTRTASYLRLSKNGYNPSFSAGLRWSLLDVNSGAELDSGTVVANLDSARPFVDDLIPLSDYEFGDRITLRIVAHHNANGFTPSGSNYFRLAAAQQTYS
jgi:hypothetical protein